MRAGVAYFNGQGTEPDYNAAAQYFQQAGDMGDRRLFLNFLAVM
jgi:TPR repeat protein